MRNRLFGLLGAVALASAMANSGCGSNNVQGGATGGNKGSGGSTATGRGRYRRKLQRDGGAASCPNGTACGGSVIGTWNVIVILSGPVG